jgi:hypothetical protein
MANRKPTKAASDHSEKKWEEDDVKYPRKRDICSCCKQRDDVKLAYDMHNYICLNMHACLLRLGKLQEK